MHNILSIHNSCYRTNISFASQLRTDIKSWTNTLGLECVRNRRLGCWKHSSAKRWTAPENQTCEKTITEGVERSFSNWSGGKSWMAKHRRWDPRYGWRVEVPSGRGRGRIKSKNLVCFVWILYHLISIGSWFVIRNGSSLMMPFYYLRSHLFAPPSAWCSYHFRQSTCLKDFSSNDREKTRDRNIQSSVSKDYICC